jgi:molybdopterin synthase catalytic subunit
MDIRVQADAFDLGEEVRNFTATCTASGAIVTFTGVVRDTPAGDLDRMEIEHYPGMTQRALGEIAQKAKQRWALENVLVIHRFGTLEVGAQIMMVATASRHRVASFEAASYLMDYLKSRAPFWKKEFSTSGAEWVSARDEDEDALARWS